MTVTDSPVNPLMPATRREFNSIAFISLILSVAGFCGWFMFYIGLPFAIGAAVCGSVGLRRSKQMSGEGRRTALVGLVFGLVMTVASIVGIMMLFTGGSSG